MMAPFLALDARKGAIMYFAAPRRVKAEFLHSAAGGGCTRSVVATEVPGSLVPTWRSVKDPFTTLRVGKEAFTASQPARHPERIQRTNCAG
ncbi:hypothetical protein B0293_29805 [Amycolatopsis azurea DSM 43854]|uniref:Uncharacterized protein n=1 Tax=Amycolatopsis azurea DSM 43854 TaxID=1238180 RepID=A0ABX3J7Y9_9PSEU|nr:hypothetical protein B0293_29805 [Amycolatopsis azurea DSM 43854]